MSTSAPTISIPHAYADAPVEEEVEAAEHPTLSLHVIPPSPRQNLKFRDNIWFQFVDRVEDDEEELKEGIHSITLHDGDSFQFVGESEVIDEQKLDIAVIPASPRKEEVMPRGTLFHFCNETEKEIVSPIASPRSRVRIEVTPLSNPPSPHSPMSPKSPRLFRFVDVMCDGAGGGEEVNMVSMNGTTTHTPSLPSSKPSLSNGGRNEARKNQSERKESGNGGGKKFGDAKSGRRRRQKNRRRRNKRCTSSNQSTEKEKGKEKEKEKEEVKKQGRRGERRVSLSIETKRDERTVERRRENGKVQNGKKEPETMTPVFGIHVTPPPRPEMNILPRAVREQRERERARERERERERVHPPTPLSPGGHMLDIQILPATPRGSDSISEPASPVLFQFM